MEWTAVTEHRARLGESPFWDAPTQALYWVGASQNGPSPNCARCPVTAVHFMKPPPCCCFYLEHIRSRILPL